MSFTPSYLKYQYSCSDEVCKRGLSQEPYILHVEQNVWNMSPLHCECWYSPFFLDAVRKVNEQTTTRWIALISHNGVSCAGLFVCLFVCLFKSNLSIVPLSKKNICGQSSCHLVHHRHWSFFLNMWNLRKYGSCFAHLISPYSHECVNWFVVFYILCMIVLYTLDSAVGK